MEMNILAVIVNYGEEQLQYLEQVVRELKSFKKYNVTVIVNSNTKLDIPGIDYVNEVRLNDYQHLPATCKQVIHHYKDEFDGFIYTENDHLWKEHHLDNHIRYSELLPDNRIPGLIQYEEGKDNKKYYCAFGFGHNHLIPGSKEIYSNLEFCRLSNVHQASYFITKKQLDRVIQYNPEYFKNLASTNVKTLSPYGYSVKCRVNTDLFEFSNWEKVICISEFDDNLIEHLPGVYINGEKGRPQMRGTQEEMNNWIKLV
tara:strand:- start:98 stop:868 length:771 start_codon:yes stop_codon:yes gene_type:complete